LSRAFAGLDGAFFVEPGDDDVVTVLRAAWDRGRVVPSKLVDAARVFTWEHVESALIAAFEGARA
jgi:hypothetical protein